jgi:apolipoprotein N-acyltransferase
MTWPASRWFGAVASLLSGLLFLASLDIGPFGPLVLVAPVPVLVHALAARRWHSVAAAALLARIIGALGLVWAYHDVLPPIALVSWILGQAVLFALIVLATRWIARGAPGWAALLAFPLLTTASEFLFGLVSPHGSFGAIGAALVDVLPLLQLASLGGLAALAFCAGLFAMTSALAIVQARAWRSLAVLGAAPILLAAAFGFWRMSEPLDGQTRIALIAIDPISGRAADDTDRAEIVKAYTAEVRALERGVDFVVLPEAVFSSSPATSAAIETPLQNAANEVGAPVIAGFDETFTDGRHVNAALIFTPGAPVQRYLKRRLIPGLDVGYTTGESAFVDGAIGVAICKDLDFPTMIREYGERGVTLMLAPAWDFGTDGRLHAHMAVVRAVENGFALARAATDGRLTLSDRTGRIVAEAVTRSDGPTVLTADLGLRSGGTLYTRIGDVFAWIAVVAAVALIGFRSFRKPSPAGLTRGSRAEVSPGDRSPGQARG